MKNKIKIIASGGGTISHTIPLVEVLKQLDKNVFEILYIISNEGPEFEIIKNEFSYKKIYVGKIYRNIDLRNIINIFKNLVGIVQAKIIFLSFKPDLVICKGGYVTIPIIFWSIIFNKKLIIHESDSVLGFANKFASKYAKKILTAFDKKYYPKELAKKIEVCGIPLRKEFVSASIDRARHTQKSVLVIGGSQGAKTLNQFVVNNLSKFIDNNIRVIHVWGESNNKEARIFYDGLSEKYKKLYDYYLFIDKNISSIINSTDLVVTRCGATIMAELSKLNKAAVFVPYPYASQDHQECNAKIILDTDSGIIIKDDQLDSKASNIIDLLNDEKGLKKYQNNINKLMPENSTEKFVQVIEEITNAKK